MLSELREPQRTLTLPSDQDASGRTLDAHELDALAEVIARGVLTSTKGTFVKSLERRFAALIGSTHAYACASGSAAVHAAIAAIDPEPGDEIITTGITDMGAIAPILYQGAIPVFADVDPRSCNVTRATIAARLSERTRAIIVTHLFGNPCDMVPIMELANARGIPVIEDCAQAFLARAAGCSVGTIGKIGVFSLQQGKHITTGEGGLIVTDDPQLARRIFLFINKAWGYGDAKPDHYFLALNYRLSELQGAVAVRQLDKLQDVVACRRRSAAQLDATVRTIPGLVLPTTPAGAVNVYWKYPVFLESGSIPGGSPALARSLHEKNILAAPRYIERPAFMCEVIREQRTFGKSRYPFTLARPQAIDYAPERYAGTFQALDEILIIPWNEKYTGEHVTYIGDALKAAVAELRAAA